jgi:hypothetical protein
MLLKNLLSWESGHADDTVCKLSLVHICNVYLCLCEVPNERDVSFNIC